METFLGLLLFGAVFVVILLIQKGASAATSKMNQAVFSREDHHKGTVLTSTALTIDSHRPVRDVIEAVRRTLNLAAERSAVRKTLYLAAQTPEVLEFHYGNALMTFWAAQFKMSARLDGEPGSTGVYRVTEWQLADGVIVGVDEMEHLLRDIRSIVQQLDPQAITRVVDDSDAIA